MRKTLTLTLAAVLGLSATAFAQDTIIVRDPTVTGSVVIGAPPPPAVRTYILEQRAPSVVYEGEVVVGAPLPEAVELYPSPNMMATPTPSSMSAAFWSIRRPVRSSKSSTDAKRPTK